ncbi:hypothetical protein B0A49_03395 [Cryomyces minteri]|uniref:F-box domain-containing protein n=1 Tax=Cryomyces minteri TaxID=331657 RepID=A0A4U0XPN0_9PEZI|nr:hypothetical protein B0A49_03395 [Cryomyces minteri]
MTTRSTTRRLEAIVKESKPFPFLKLPGELRTCIYKEVVGFQTVEISYVLRLPAITRVSKQIRMECIGLCISMNKFRYLLTGNESSIFAVDELVAFPTVIGIRASYLITELSITVQMPLHIRFWWENPGFRHAILCSLYSWFRMFCDKQSHGLRYRNVKFDAIEPPGLSCRYCSQAGRALCDLFKKAMLLGTWCRIEEASGEELEERFDDWVTFETQKESLI